jgi:LacI family transcriptional regulator
MPRRPPKVALLIESSRTYGRGVLRGIARYIHLHGAWSCYLEERELHFGIPDWLRHWRGDGVIARIQDRRTARALRRLGHPVVDVLGSTRFKGIPSFDTDARVVAHLAADFFLQAGFRHFAFCGYRNIPFSDRRAAAMATRLAERGHRLRVFSLSAPRARPLSIRGAPAEADIQAAERGGLERENAIAAWLRRQPRPLALFACNDVCGQQVLNACREHGLKVPEEVAVMGVDNDDVLCSLSEPPLSSIEPDTERLGYEAAATLDGLLRGQPGTGALRQIPPRGIVERNSTDVVPVADPVLAQALRFIRDRLGSGIVVKDVLEEVSRSRTDVESRFRRHLRTSVRREILRQRLERARALLRQTNLPIEDVAARVGFSSDTHFCRLFQTHLRTTPTRFREGQNQGEAAVTP